MKRVAGRFASPVGLLLALLLFLFLPFVSVSCDTGIGEVRADYSGLDVVVAADSEFDIPPQVAKTWGSLGQLFDEPGEDSQDGPPTPEPLPSAGVLPAVLAAAMALVVLAGLGAALLTAGRRRLRVTAYAAGVAGALLVIAQVFTQHGIADAVLASAREGREERTVQRLEAVIGTLIASGAGFWLPLILLLAVALACVTALNWQQWRHRVPKIVVRLPAQPPPS